MGAAEIKGRMKKLLRICCLTGLVLGVLIPCLVDAANTDSGGIMPGDVYQDGKVDGKDISLLLQYRLKKTKLTTDQFTAGDVYTDAKIDGKDVSKLLQFRLGKINSLGGTTPAPGNTAEPVGGSTTEPGSGSTTEPSGGSTTEPGGGAEDIKGKYKVSGTIKTKSGTQIKQYHLEFALKSEYDEGSWTPHDTSVNVNNGTYEIYLEPGEYVISGFDFDNDYENFENGIVEVKGSNQTRAFVFDGYYFSGTLRRGGGVAVEESFDCRVTDDFNNYNNWITIDYGISSDESGFFSFCLSTSVIEQRYFGNTIDKIQLYHSKGGGDGYKYEFAFDYSDRTDLELTNELYKVTGKVMNHNGSWDFSAEQVEGFGYVDVWRTLYPHLCRADDGGYFERDDFVFTKSICELESFEYNQEIGMIEYECYVPAGTYCLGIDYAGPISETTFTVSDRDLKDVDINFNVFRYECKLEHDGSSGYVRDKDDVHDYARIFDPYNWNVVNLIDYDAYEDENADWVGYLNSGRYDVEICVYKEGNADETEWKTIGSFYVDENNTSTTIKY